jgi:hypothetical protein
VANSIPHGAKGYYLATTGEYRLLEATQAVGATMLKHGWTTDPTPTSLTEAEADKYYPGLEEQGSSKWYSGSNSRGVSAQARSLGWKPKHEDVNEFYDYCKIETERLAKPGKPYWR